MRSRRSAWWMGECLYIIEAALLYVLFLTVVSFLTAVPVISFEPDWGDALRDLVIGTREQSAEDIRWGYGIYNTPGRFAYYLDPLKTQIYTFLTSWASFSVLGLLMYLISLIHKRASLGMASAGILIFLDPVIYSINSMKTKKSWIDLLSPVCWTDAGLLKAVNKENFLDTAMVAGMYIFFLIVLLVAISVVSKNVMIEIVGDQLRGE